MDALQATMDRDFGTIAELIRLHAQARPSGPP